MDALRALATSRQIRAQVSAMIPCTRPSRTAMSSLIILLHSLYHCPTVTMTMWMLFSSISSPSQFSLC